MNKRFEEIILMCQDIREREGCSVTYEESTIELRKSLSNEIIDNDLINKCSDKTYAAQLCIMNELKYK